MRTILLTGGIGDILTIDAHTPPEERALIERIYWAAPNQRAMIPLFRACPEWRHVEQVMIWEEWGNRRAFHRLVELRHTLRGRVNFAGVEDWSISVKFPAIKGGHLRFEGSAFQNHRLAPPIGGLPPRYAIVCPATISPHRGQRFFTPDDWPAVLRWLEDDDTIGVVVNQGSDPVPDHPRLLNLTDKLDLPQAVEIAKRADAYLGVNSSLSVVAGWNVPRDRFFVRSREGHTTSNLSIYYPRMEGVKLLPSLSGIVHENPKERWVSVGDKREGGSPGRDKKAAS